MLAEWFSCFALQVKPDHYPVRIYAEQTSELVFNLTRAASGSEFASSVRLCAAVLQSGPGGPLDGEGVVVRRARPGYFDESPGRSPSATGEAAGGRAPAGGRLQHSGRRLQQGDHKNIVNQRNSGGSTVWSQHSRSLKDGGIPGRGEAPSPVRTIGSIVRGAQALVASSGGGGGLPAAAVADAAVLAAGYQLSQQPFNASAWQKLAETRAHEGPLALTVALNPVPQSVFRPLKTQHLSHGLQLSQGFASQPSQC